MSKVPKSYRLEEAIMDKIDILAELQNVNLDSRIFKTAGFLNLTDFAVDLPSQPIGRSNPFESIQGGVRATPVSR